MEAAPLRSMLKFPSDYRRSRPVLSLIQTLASKYLKSIIGRLVEVTNGGFVALQSQNLASAEWQLWRSASGKNGSVAISDDWPLSEIGISLTASRL